MAKKQPIVAHLTDKAARVKNKAKGIANASDTADAIRAAAAARRKTAAVAPVLTSVATKARAGSMLVPAPVPTPQVELGGTWHLFVNLELGALFVWDPASHGPKGVFVKYSSHFYRQLGNRKSGYIHPENAGIRCYHLPENEVAKTLGETRFQPKG